MQLMLAPMIRLKDVRVAQRDVFETMDIVFTAVMTDAAVDYSSVDEIF